MSHSVNDQQRSLPGWGRAVRDRWDNNGNLDEGGQGTGEALTRVQVRPWAWMAEVKAKRWGAGSRCPQGASCWDVAITSDDEDRAQRGSL